MASSRVFIKGLPPTISEEEFRTHFSAQQAITDAKLIPHRRIGYVGYKTPEAAAKAVKYFNKSFIRMSKIGVELARPVSICDLLSVFDYLARANRSRYPIRPCHYLERRRGNRKRRRLYWSAENG